MLELQRLRYFIAVAELEHFHRAAQTLHIAQPALSRQIKLLEKDLGFDVFERLPRGVRLTEAGRIFLADAKRVMVELERAVEHAQSVASGRAGALRIGFLEIASVHGVFPETIRNYRSKYPTTRLILEPLDSGAQIRRLLEGSIDAGFLYRRASTEASIVHKTVHSEKFMLAVPSTHALAKQAQIRLMDLRDEPFIWADRLVNVHFDHVLMSACLKRGLVPKIVQEATSAVHILSLVAVGIGLGLVPSSAQWRLQHGTVLKEVEDLNVVFEIDIAWLRNNRSASLSQFVELTFRNAKRTLRDRLEPLRSLADA